MRISKNEIFMIEKKEENKGQKFEVNSLRIKAAENRVKASRVLDS